MNENYDWDIFEVFKEQIEIQLPKLEQQILLLDKKETKTDAVNELFRAFHTYKPNTDYLHLQPFYELVHKVETVLSILREDKSAVSESIIQWLFLVVDQITLWFHEMEDGKNTLSPYPAGLLEKVQVTPSRIKPSQRLKELTLLYVDTQATRAKKISTFLTSLAKICIVKTSIKEAQQFLQTEHVDIVIMNLAKENFVLVDYMKNKFPNTSTLAIFDKISSITLKRLLSYGISHTTTNPLSAKALQRELLSIVKTFFSSNTVLIDHKNIAVFIQTLQPLPNTIMQIMQICDDDEIPIKELIKVVKTDPIIAANILNVANSPLYGNVALKTIDQAVTRFGKRVVKALAMNGMKEALGEIHLEAYEMTEETFSKVSMNRLSLMLKWYAKVNIADLNILSSTALLGNIGQLLIAKEIEAKNQKDDFLDKARSVNFKYAEESLLHTTTNIISSQILNYWQLSKDVVDIIAFGDTPEEAPEELRRLAVANHIVYTLVDNQGKIMQVLSDEILLLLANHGFDPKSLEKALAHLHEVNK